jgi:hypothetical protein
MCLVLRDLKTNDQKKKMKLVLRPEPLSIKFLNVKLIDAVLSYQVRLPKKVGIESNSILVEGPVLL